MGIYNLCYIVLLDELPGAQGHHMVTDRYTSFVLVEELYNNNNNNNIVCNLRVTIHTNKLNTLKKIVAGFLIIKRLILKS